jgi:hypothetical protein
MNSADSIYSVKFTDDVFVPLLRRAEQLINDKADQTRKGSGRRRAECCYDELMRIEYNNDRRVHEDNTVKAMIRFIAKADKVNIDINKEKNEIKQQLLQPQQQAKQQLQQQQHDSHEDDEIDLFISDDLKLRVAELRSQVKRFIGLIASHLAHEGSRWFRYCPRITTSFRFVQLHFQLTLFSFVIIYSLRIMND